MTDFEKVTDFENLYRAFRKAKRGKGHKKSAARFSAMALEGIHALSEQLRSGTYKVSPYTEFKVYEPKERDIKAAAFKDKVVQHSLCDNVLLPRLSKVFIKENSAGQKGKGTLYALELLKEQLCEFYGKHGRNGYILKCDITKFFYNIRHEELKNIIAYYFDDVRVCRLCEQIIDSTDGVGLPLGNQTSQGFALLYLDGMDKMITGELGIEYYGRYMDDFYLVHTSKEYLKHCLEAIREFTATLGLELNGKTQIFPINNGVDFLGFHTYLTADGECVRKLKNEKKRAALKKYNRMAKLVRSGNLKKARFDDSYGSWKNHISHGNCKTLAKNTDEKIKIILEGAKDENQENNKPLQADQARYNL